MKPLLSVAVPTHNRARYAVHAIESLLSIESSRLEVVVSDTSTDGELAGLLAQRSWSRDPRLKYLQPPGPLDMTGNHNAVLSQVAGEYVCLIGDDDTISPEALTAAEWAAEHGVEVIAPNVVANYVWPDFRTRVFGRAHASRLYFAPQMGRARFQASPDCLRIALKQAVQGTDGLPKIYHGIVRRDLLEEVRVRSGAFFHGSSPDVSGAVALATVARRHLVVDFPLTIPGASGGSNTGRSALNRHKGKLESEEQTRRFQQGGWSPGVPRFFSVETVWAHAALTTLAKLKGELTREFSFSRLLALCRLRHPEYAAEIEAAVDEAAGLLGTSRTELVRSIRQDMRAVRVERLGAIARRLIHPTAAGGRSYVRDLPTVARAPAELQAYLRTRGVTWQGVVGSLPVT